MNSERALHDAHLRYQRSATCNAEAVDARIRRGAKRQATPPTALIIWRSMSDQYRAMFCEHGKAMWQVCGSCRRNRHEAQRNFHRLVGCANQVKP